MYCYMVIETFLVVDYSISLLSYIIKFPSLETWAWLQLGHTENRHGCVLYSLVESVRNHDVVKRKGP